MAVNLALVGLGVLCQMHLFERWFLRALDPLLRLTMIAAWGFAVFGLVPVVLGIARRRKNRVRQPFLAGRFWFAIVVALVVSESLCGVVLWSKMTSTLRQMAITLPSGLSAPPERELHVVALGGSTMLGSPYDPKFGIPTVVAWRMRKMYPDKTIVMKNLSVGGQNLRESIRCLKSLKTKPHLLLLYSGHNEFYNEMGGFIMPAESPFGGLDPLLQWSPTFVLLDRSLSRQLAMHVLRNGTESFVANPISTRADYNRRLVRFRRLLVQLAQYCRREEIAAIWFVPASSESGFEPNRSVPSRFTTERSRRELRRLYDRARSLETDGKWTEAADLYRRGLGRQPGFAEFHFRLGHCSLELGHNAEAAKHFSLAMDNDGHPIRANRHYRDLVTAVANEIQIPLIDSPHVLRQHTEKGILDRTMFHDNVHLTMKGYYLLGIAACERLLDDKRLIHRFDTPVVGNRPEFEQAVSDAGITLYDLELAYARTARGLLWMTRWRFDSTDREHDSEQFDRWSRQLKDREIKPGDDGTEALP